MKKMLKEITEIKRLMGINEIDSGGEQYRPYSEDEGANAIEAAASEEDDSDESEHKINLGMAIMSHLSDLQETSTENRGILNFVKAMVSELSDGVKEMSEKELTALYYKWNNQ